MSLATRLLNDYLFATSKYLDSAGNKQDASPPEKIFSAPEAKIGMLAAASTGLGLAAGGHMVESLSAVFDATMVVSATMIKNIRHDATVPREFYFDTQPETKIGISDPVIYALLKTDHKNLKSKFLSSTMWAAVPTVTAAILAPPLLPAMLALAVPLYANFVVGDVGRWWRADHALKGKWNVLTHIPMPDTEPATDAAEFPAPASP